MRAIWLIQEEDKFNKRGSFFTDSQTVLGALNQERSSLPALNKVRQPKAACPRPTRYIRNRRTFRQDSIAQIVSPHIYGLAKMSLSHHPLERCTEDIQKV